ncbi:MAG: hypothetical protein IPK80_20900 [Nannocystis sp.]|nr:hypothetical protein [Nannocystis sp.]
MDARHHRQRQRHRQQGFHGIGTGNKAMLGTDAPILLGLPLAQLTSRSASATPCAPQATPTSSIVRTSTFSSTSTATAISTRSASSIAILTPLLNLLVDVAQADPTDHEYLLSWVGAGKLKIVNELAGVTPAVDPCRRLAQQGLPDLRHPRHLP